MREPGSERGSVREREREKRGGGGGGGLVWGGKEE